MGRVVRVEMETVFEILDNGVDPADHFKRDPMFGAHSNSLAVTNVSDPNVVSLQSAILVQDPGFPGPMACPFHHDAGLVNPWH